MPCVRLPHGMVPATLHAVETRVGVVVGVLLSLTSALACSGPRFSGTGAAAGKDGGGGSGGTPSAGGMAGTAGEGPAGFGGSGGSQAGRAGVAGSSGTGGSAGKAGSAGAAGCDCNPGQYCRAGTCRDCADLSSVETRAPEEVLDHPNSGLRFPRVGASPSSLFFTLLAPSRSELWYVEDPEASASITLGDAQTPSRSGLFYAGGGSFEFSALFDQVDGAQRGVMTAAWDGSTLSDIRSAGAPFGAAGADDYGVALAAATSRVYFMSTRDGSPALYTGLLGSSSATVVTLEVPRVSGGGTCARSGEDATPWVTEDGSLLVFRSLPMDATCEPVDGSASDLYVAALQPATGMALTTAVALSGVNVTTGESTETDPSFSPDLCVLYFASDGGSAGGFDFKLFRAERR
jgi:hypothetical protein